MKEPAPRYWFPAKRYGWGWGLPVTWEGWAVLAGFAALAALVVVSFPVESEPVKFFAGVVALSVSLVAICWWKGCSGRAGTGMCGSGRRRRRGAASC